MRLLHTSDWHLGRTFHREPLIDAQRAFVDHLVTVVRQRDVDVVLVAGDVYDRAIPALDAVELYDHALRQLADLDVPVVLVSGNHDSPRRLGVAASLLERAGVHLRTEPAGCATPVLLRDAHGPVAVYGIPYLEPHAAARPLGAEQPTHQCVLQAATAAVRADLATRPGTRSVVLAHAFVTGAAGSDSERDISVGGVPTVPAAVFDGIDYVALGHLHRPQRVGERIRYSGSPIAYSFSEAASEKSMLLVDLGPAGQIDTESVPVPCQRPLAVLTGHLEDLLADPAHERVRDAWVQVTLTDSHRPVGAMERLRARFPHTVHLTFAPEHAPADAVGSYLSRTARRSDVDIALGFVEHVRGGPPDASERQVLREAVEAAAGLDRGEKPGGTRRAVATVADARGGADTRTPGPRGPSDGARERV